MGHLAFATAIEAMISALLMRWRKDSDTGANSRSNPTSPPSLINALPVSAHRELRNWRSHHGPACRSECV